MTRNTKCYVIKDAGKEILYRDLTISELSFLDKVKNEIKKKELAATMSLVDAKLHEVPWATLLKIGESVLTVSLKPVFDPDMFEILVREYRESIKVDQSLVMVDIILKVLPNESYQKLMDLTYRDLIELICFCENFTGKQLFKIGKFGASGRKLMDPKEVGTDARSLQEKINELNKFVGIPT